MARPPVQVAADKLRPALNSCAARADPGDRLEVIIELTRIAMPQRATRRERIAAAQAAFDDEADSIRQAIEEVGGRITGEAWLNQTMRAELPKHALVTIAAHDSVVAIDTPVPLREDGAIMADG